MSPAAWKLASYDRSGKLLDVRVWPWNGGSAVPRTVRLPQEADMLKVLLTDAESRPLVPARSL